MIDMYNIHNAPRTSWGKRKKKFVQNRLYNRKKKKGNCETALGTLSF